VSEDGSFEEYSDEKRGNITVKPPDSSDSRPYSINTHKTGYLPQKTKWARNGISISRARYTLIRIHKNDHQRPRTIARGLLFLNEDFAGNPTPFLSKINTLRRERNGSPDLTIKE
jgi:hypothetical protein